MLLESVLRRLGPAAPELPRVDEEERLRTYPPPFPTGWYALCESHELSPGEIRFVEALGNKFVVFRDDSGDVGALDAYCPHLGTNLAGGRIKDGCIECPFHRWKFAADGEVRSIPYVERIPDKVRARSWRVREHHGLITIWSGQGPAAWELEADPDIEDGSLVYRGRYDAGVVRMHLCEFAENSADDRHFAPIHGEMFVPWTGFKVPGIRIHHDARWERDENVPHIAYFHDNAILEVAGRRIERTKAKATITFYGPGSVVAFRFDIPDMGKITMFQTHLPEAPLAQRVRFRWFAEQRIPRALVFYVIGNWISQWRQDISIWENKIFLPKPMLVAGDGPVHRMRSWFQQFYE
jgi:cholesterol 7-dehydrogenase